MAKNTQKEPATPPYERLAGRIRQMISSRRLGSGEFVGTEAEFARTCGRARMTVRRAVETLIASGHLERRPGRGVFVRGEKSKTRSVAFIAGNLAWEPGVRMLHGVMEEAAKSGVNVRIVDAHGDAAIALDAVSALPESGADGAVLASLHTPEFNAALCGLVSKGFPFAVVDQRLVDIAAPSVVSDNRRGGELAAEAVIREGHAAIAFVGDLDATTTMERLKGVRAAATAAGLGNVSEYDIGVDDRFADWAAKIRSATLRLLRARERPTAVVCSCDAVARSVMRTIGAHGIKVPEEMSVVGFDDDPIAEWMTPSLSTVRQNFTEMGREAMKALEERLSDPKTPPSARVVPVEYVKRESVARWAEDLSAGKPKGARRIK